MNDYFNNGFGYGPITQNPFEMNSPFPRSSLQQALANSFGSFGYPNSGSTMNPFRIGMGSPSSMSFPHRGLAEIFTMNSGGGGGSRYMQNPFMPMFWGDFGNNRNNNSFGNFLPGLGQAIGSYFGGPIGGAIGNFGGNFLSSLFD